MAENSLRYLQELLDETVLPGSSPYDGVILVGKHEANTHHTQIVLNIDRRPAIATLMNLFSLQAQHSWDAWSTDIYVQEPYLCQVGAQLAMGHDLQTVALQALKRSP